MGNNIPIPRKPDTIQAKEGPGLPPREWWCRFPARRGCDSPQTTEPAARVAFVTPKRFAVPRLLFLMLFMALAAGARQVQVAVNDLVPRGVAPTDVEILGDRLRAELLATGAVRVMERSQMDQILKEQAFQQSGACEGGECAVQIGKLLAVDRMVVGSVGRIGELYTVQLRILDVGTGEIVFGANQDHAGRIEGLLSKVVPDLARRLAAAMTSDSSRSAGSSVPAARPYAEGSTSKPTALAPPAVPDAKPRSAKPWIRWGCAIGAVGAGVVGVLSHREAADQKDKAAEAVWRYNEAKSGFEDYKNIHLRATREANDATDRAIVSDVAAGVLLAGFAITFAF